MFFYCAPTILFSIILPPPRVCAWKSRREKNTQLEEKASILQCFFFLLPLMSLERNNKVSGKLSSLSFLLAARVWVYRCEKGAEKALFVVLIVKIENGWMRALNYNSVNIHVHLWNWSSKTCRKVLYQFNKRAIEDDKSNHLYLYCSCAKKKQAGDMKKEELSEAHQLRVWVRVSEWRKK